MPGQQGMPQFFLPRSMGGQGPSGLEILRARQAQQQATRRPTGAQFNQMYGPTGPQAAPGPGFEEIMSGGSPSTPIGDPSNPVAQSIAGMMATVENLAQQQGVRLQPGVPQPTGAPMGPGLPPPQATQPPPFDAALSSIGALEAGPHRRHGWGSPSFGAQSIGPPPPPPSEPTIPTVPGVPDATTPAPTPHPAEDPINAAWSKRFGRPYPSTPHPGYGGTGDYVGPGLLPDPDSLDERLQEWGPFSAEGSGAGIPPDTPYGPPSDAVGLPPGVPAGPPSDPVGLPQGTPYGPPSDPVGLPPGTPYGPPSDVVGLPPGTPGGPPPAVDPEVLLRQRSFQSGVGSNIPPVEGPHPGYGGTGSYVGPGLLPEPGASVPPSTPFGPQQDTQGIYRGMDWGPGGKGGQFAPIPGSVPTPGGGRTIRPESGPQVEQGQPWPSDPVGLPPGTPGGPPSDRIGLPPGTPLGPLSDPVGLPPGTPYGPPSDRIGLPPGTPYGPPSDALESPFDRAQGRIGSLRHDAVPYGPPSDVVGLPPGTPYGPPSDPVGLPPGTPYGPESSPQSFDEAQGRWGPFSASPSRAGIPPGTPGGPPSDLSGLLPEDQREWLKGVPEWLQKSIVGEGLKTGEAEGGSTLDEAIRNIGELKGNPPGDYVPQPSIGAYGATPRNIERDVGGRSVSGFDEAARKIGAFGVGAGIPPGTPYGPPSDPVGLPAGTPFGPPSDVVGLPPGTPAGPPGLQVEQGQPWPSDPIVPEATTSDADTAIPEDQQVTGKDVAEGEVPGVEVKGGVANVVGQHPARKLPPPEVEPSAGPVLGEWYTDSEGNLKQRDATGKTIADRAKGREPSNLDFINKQKQIAENSVKNSNEEIRRIGFEEGDFKLGSTNNAALNARVFSGIYNMGGYGTDPRALKLGMKPWDELWKAYEAGIIADREGSADKSIPILGPKDRRDFVLGLLLKNLKGAYDAGHRGAALKSMVAEYGQIHTFGDGRPAKIISRLLSRKDAITIQTGNPGFGKGNEKLYNAVLNDLDDPNSETVIPGDSWLRKTLGLAGDALSWTGRTTAEVASLGYWPETTVEWRSGQELPWYWKGGQDEMSFGDKDMLDVLYSKRDTTGKQSPARQFALFGLRRRHKDALDLFGYHKNAYGKDDEKTKAFVQQLEFIRNNFEQEGLVRDDHMAIIKGVMAGDEIEGIDEAEILEDVGIEAIIGEKGGIFQRTTGHIDPRGDDEQYKYERELQDRMLSEGGGSYGWKELYESGQTEGSVLGEVQVTDAGDIIRRGDEGWDEEKGGKVMRGGKPSTVLPLKIGQVSKEQQAALDEQAEGAKVAHKQSSKSIADTIIQQAAEGAKLWDTKHGKEAIDRGAESLSTSANNIMKQQLQNETEITVAKLKSEEALMEFGKIMSEAFVQMGDSLVAYSGGVRPGDKPSYVPTSILGALQSSGAKREAAVMRLSNFAMTGHLFPEGSTVESMKAQMNLLQHSQNLHQKNKQFLMTHEFNTFQTWLNYNEKVLGHRLTAANRDVLRNQWERDFAHKREYDAYNYSLNRAKANVDQIGSLRLDRLELETIEGLEQTLDLSYHILNEKKKHGTGWFINLYENAGNYGGWGSPEWHGFKQMVTTQLNIYVNKLTGKQLSKHEVARLKGSVPQITDDDGIFVAKCKTFIAIQEAIMARKLQLYSMNGHDVGPFMKNKRFSYKIDGGAERQADGGSFREQLRRDPTLVTKGRIQMLTGPGGALVRPGEDYLGTIFGDYIDPTTHKYRGPGSEDQRALAKRHEGFFRGQGLLGRAGMSVLTGGRAK